jgi:CRP-like cAMP-binding protein
MRVLLVVMLAVASAVMVSPDSDWEAIVALDKRPVAKPTSMEEAQLPSAGITANLDNDSREVLGSHGTFHVAPAGTVLITQGKPHGRLFCVISGTFEARR